MIKRRNKLKRYDKNWLDCTYIRLFYVYRKTVPLWSATVFFVSHLSFLISNFPFGPILRPDGNFCGLYVTGWFCGIFGIKMVVWSHFSPKSDTYIKFFGYFFFFPKSKTPNLNLEVSSINGFAVNIRQWGSYEGMRLWQLAKKWRIFYIFSTYFKNIFSFLRTSEFKKITKNATKIK